jgi:hypothetical protein
VEYIQVQDDYFIIDKGKIKIRFPCKDVRSAVISQENVTFKEKAPMLYDEEQGLVYPDPFYVGGEETSDNSCEKGLSEERPMSVAEMRIKIKELEEQLTDTKRLLETVMQSLDINNGNLSKP